MRLRFTPNITKRCIKALHPLGEDKLWPLWVRTIHYAGREVRFLGFWTAMTKCALREAVRNKLECPRRCNLPHQLSARNKGSSVVICIRNKSSSCWRTTQDTAYLGHTARGMWTPSRFQQRLSGQCYLLNPVSRTVQLFRRSPLAWAIPFSCGAYTRKVFLPREHYTSYTPYFLHRRSPAKFE